MNNHMKSLIVNIFVTITVGFIMNYLGFDISTPQYWVAIFTASSLMWYLYS